MAVRPDDYHLEYIAQLVAEFASDAFRDKRVSTPLKSEDPALNRAGSNPGRLAVFYVEQFA